LVAFPGALAYDAFAPATKRSYSDFPLAEQPRETIVFCIVPADLAAGAHDALREHFRDKDVEVVVEHRRRERRDASDRRGDRAVQRDDPKRLIRDEDGRRVADRRAALKLVETQHTLPPELEDQRDRLQFVERRVPSTVAAEDVDTAYLVKRLQAGDKSLYGELYLRYFDRVYSYLRMSLRDPHEAEDVAQDVFMKVYESLATYERRGMPFRFWLFRIARNRAVDRLKSRKKVDLEEPAALDQRREGSSAATDEQLALLTDRNLLGLVEHLPESQRQVLALRFVVDLSTAQICQVLGRSPDAVRQLEARALRSLRQRAAALGNRQPTYA
jgi:RNA polymerase sigma-70 factor (ECF subfamily)